MRGPAMGSITMDSEQKIKNHLESVGHDLDSWSGVSALIRYNLSNFCYRYISTEADPEPKVQELAFGIFAGESVETNLVSGLKLGGSELKNDLIQMAKRVGKGATIGQRLVVEVKNYRERAPLDLIIRAQISWGHPDHSYEHNYRERVQKIHFSEALELRNKLALALEEICAFF